MMIIPKVLGLSVTVFVDKDPATEYTCLHRTSRTAGSEPCKGIPTEQCYIESKAVSTYFIQYRISPTFKLPENANHLAFDLYVDGKFFVGKSVHRDSLKGTNDYIGSISYRLTTAENGTSYSERLTFQNLSSNEKADCKTTDRDIKRLPFVGEIRVAVSFAKQTESKTGHENRRVNANEPSLVFSQKARVRSDPAVRHGTRCKRIRNARTPKVRNIKLTPQCCAGDYHFYYRPYDALVSQGVIPYGSRHICQSYLSFEGIKYPCKIRSDGGLEIDLTGEN
ncbi:hypothetical protein FPOAC2_13441 [Fusarium poae]|uniref:uncharacterized protein n=1 Tax=Fusarium poae TaxID=36050 RepID=UPI001D0482BB|nr:uncharacterized protein FPOAC1_013809 [Fusarium poae]KAG8664471.1 hypothetical protein FPOAC1_013809 [Fusarium poae]